MLCLLMLLCVVVQALNESIVEHGSELSEVLRLGDELRQLAVGDDVTRLDSELRSVTDRYTALRTTSAERLRQLTETPAILERFYTTHQTIINLMSELESDLQQRDIQPGPEAELHLQVSLVFYQSTGVVRGVTMGRAPQFITLKNFNRINTDNVQK